MRTSTVYSCEFCSVSGEHKETIKRHEESMHPEEIAERNAKHRQANELPQAIMNVYNGENENWEADSDDSEVEVTNVDFTRDPKITSFEDLTEFTATENVKGYKVITFKRK